MMLRGAILAALCATAVWHLSAKTAVPHEWYDRACCSGRDCQRIEPDSVRVTPGGWEVTILGGTHPFVPETRTEFFPWGDPRIRRSQDQDFHACVTPAMRNFICFYTPDMGA